MKLTNAEDRDRRLEADPRQLSGNGWRRHIALRRGRSWLLTVLMLAILVAAGAWAFYANVKSGGAAMDMSMRVTSGNTPFPVLIVPVERGTVTGTVTYTGSVLPFNEEDIYPRVTGRIVEMPVYPGDLVRPGQVLARLDSVELSSKVREADAALAVARASRTQTEKELAAAVAEAGYARAVADRAAKLFSIGAVSRQDLENNDAAAVAAEAKVEAARARIEAATSVLEQSEAALRTATTIRDYVTIVASSPGYVVKRVVAPGVLVQPGMAILKLVQIDRVRLQANVGEKDLASVRPGSPVQVTTTSGAQPRMAVKVTAVFPFVDQGPRTAVVEALVDNAARRFLPGQYVTMRFVTGERSDALTVPTGAVVRMGVRATVWIAKEGRAEPRAVTTGLESPERIEIREGLSGDERVIASGHEGLYAGARVADLSSAVPASSPPPAEQKEGGAHSGH